MTAPWRPTAFLRFEKCFETSTGVAKVVTDAGHAYLKALGNAEGPYALASEWVGTRLADWFGLQTLDHALLKLTEDDEIPLGRKKKAEPGTAFVTKAITGHVWGGTDKELKRVQNVEDITRLVVFDTWIRNRDRHPPASLERRPNPDNVFLSGEGASPKRAILYAIDHTHCFMPGSSMSERIRDIGNVQDENIYGLFPAFKPYLTAALVEGCLVRLRQLDRGTVSEIIGSLPDDWEVRSAVRAAWTDFVVSRAGYLDDTLLHRIGEQCWPGQLFDNGLGPR